MAEHNSDSHLLDVGESVQREIRSARRQQGKVSDFPSAEPLPLHVEPAELQLCADGGGPPHRHRPRTSMEKNRMIGTLLPPWKRKITLLTGAGVDSARKFLGGEWLNWKIRRWAF